MNQSLISQQNFPVLPEGATQLTIASMVDDIAAHYRMSPGLKAYLRLIVMIPHSSDWTSPTTEPVCYKEQTALADKLCVTDRCIRKYERQLEDFGLAKINTGGGGRRGSFGNGSTKLGISLTPLVERYAELAAIAHSVNERVTAKVALRHQISAAKRSLTSNLSRIATAITGLCETYTRLSQIRDSLPRRIANLSLDDLRPLYTLTKNAAADAEQLAVQYLGRNTWADEPEQIGRPLIQDSTEDLYESLSQSDSKAHIADDASKEDLEGFSPQRTAMKLAMKFSLDDLTQMANPDMGDYLLLASDRGLTARTFVEAAVGYWAACGLPMSAWRAAEVHLGPMCAALSVLVITANTDRSENPIQQPAAMLHKFVSLAREGKLNLEGSLLGLHRRKLPHFAIAA